MQIDSSVKTLLETCNIMSQEHLVSEALFEQVTKEHRTIQQSFMRELNNFLIAYSDELYDARNKESVMFAKKVKELNHYFPFV